MSEYDYAIKSLEASLSLHKHNAEMCNKYSLWANQKSKKKELKRITQLESAIKRLKGG